MERHFCDGCGCDMETINSYELVFKKLVHGIKVSDIMGEFCSLRCADKWRNRYRRGIIKNIEREGSASQITFFNYELQRYFGSWEIQEEKGSLYIKVSNQRFGMN